MWLTDEENDDDDCAVIDATNDSDRVTRSDEPKKGFVVGASRKAIIMNLANELIDLHSSLESIQDQRRLAESVEKCMRSIEERRIEKVLPPRRKVSVRGRPKNTKRRKTHYELSVEKEKEELKEVAKREKKQQAKKDEGNAQI